MSKQIALPSGATATLRDPSSLKQKDRAKLYDGLEGDVTSISSGMQIVTRLISILVEDWSFELIIPSVKEESLGELSIADFDFLSEQAQGAMSVLFPQLAKTVDGDSNPKATTENFNA
jgi:hypothetical protein